MCDAIREILTWCFTFKKKIDYVCTVPPLLIAHVIRAVVH